MWVASIFSCVDDEEIAGCSAKHNSILFGTPLKMQLKSLWIDLQLKNIQQDLILFDKFKPQENLGSLLKLKNQIWCKN